MHALLIYLGMGVDDQRNQIWPEKMDRGSNCKYLVRPMRRAITSSTANNLLKRDVGVVHRRVAWLTTGSLWQLNPVTHSKSASSAR